MSRKSTQFDRYFAWEDRGTVQSARIPYYESVIRWRLEQPVACADSERCFISMPINDALALCRVLGDHSSDGDDEATYTLNVYRALFHALWDTHKDALNAVLEKADTDAQAKENK